MTRKHHVTIETKDVRRTNKNIYQRWSCACGATGGDKWTTSEVAHAAAEAHQRKEHMDKRRLAADRRRNIPNPEPPRTRSGVPGYSNFGGGGPFAPMAAPAPARSERRLSTQKMREVGKRVATGSYPAYSTDRTIRALERIGVVEHTSTGWILTDAGVRWAKELS